MTELKAAGMLSEERHASRFFAFSQILAIKLNREWRIAFSRISSGTFSPFFKEVAFLEKVLYT